MSTEGESRVSRREFVRITGSAGGGLLVAVSIPRLVPAGALAAGEGALATGTEAGTTSAAAPGFEPNAWLRITADGTVHFTVDELEMGQGVVNALPMIVAEELGVELEAIRTEGPPENPAAWPRSIATYGSTTIRNAWEPLRTAAAQAREVLKSAAARRWGVESDSLRALDGHVIHPASGRRLAFGDLAGEAATLPVPDEVPFRDPSEYRILGKPTPRSDTAEKLDGSLRYAIDVRVDGMRVAVVARPPAFGATVDSFDDRAARRVAGVEDVLEIDSGVAVVARDTWAALRGRDALEVRWREEEAVRVDSESLSRRLRELARGSGAAEARHDGDVDSALAGARDGDRVAREYEVPYLAHACMEPMNCAAHVRDGEAEVWAPTQSASGTQRAAAELTGLPPESVVVHAHPMGGGFGRRSSTDFVREAVELSMEVGAPVKVMWTREDDVRGGHYRSAACHRFQAVLGSDGYPVAWDHQLGGPSLLGQINPSVLERTGGWGPNALNGARQLPYAIPNVRVAHALAEVEVPLWWWRSVGHSHNAFATECFVDELAAAAGADPYRYRRRLLSDEPRLRGVLELAAEAAGWGDPLPEGHGHGVACHPAFGSYVAQVAQVSVADDGRVRVHRLVSAVDCGQVINPDTVETQVAGAAVFALSAVLHGKITLRDGRVQQGNFDDYPILRIDEMPAADVHIVRSSEAPGGVGELGTPAVAPAVANAVYAATGTRVRWLPIDPEELRRS